MTKTGEREDGEVLGGWAVVLTVERAQRWTGKAAELEDWE